MISEGERVKEQVISSPSMLCEGVHSAATSLVKTGASAQGHLRIKRMRWNPGQLRNQSQEFVKKKFLTRLVIVAVLVIDDVRIFLFCRLMVVKVEIIFLLIHTT